MSFCTLKSGVVICGLDSGVLIRTLNSPLVSPGWKRVKHNLDEWLPFRSTYFLLNYGFYATIRKTNNTFMSHLCSFYFYSIKYSKLTSMC